MSNVNKGGFRDLRKKVTALQTKIKSKSSKGWEKRPKKASNKKKGE